MTLFISYRDRMAVAPSPQYLMTLRAGALLAFALTAPWLDGRSAVAANAHARHGIGPPAVSSGVAAHPQAFPRSTQGLPRAKPMVSVVLKRGDAFGMDIAPVKRTIAGHPVRMLAYAGSVPGPVLHVPQGGEIGLRLHNLGDTDTSLHAHGLRLENAYDGVPGWTQRAQRIGETLEYRLRFPDPGVFWYHPHVRTDYALASGLYGAIVVSPSDPAYWSPVNRELVMLLSDLDLDASGERIPFYQGMVDHTLMGRYGNVLLVNGETHPRFPAKRGEVVRLYVVNASNARVFNLGIPGAKMKLVGTGLGRYAHESWVDSVLLAPGERRVVDVMFERPGDYELQHRTPARTHPLGRITVAPEAANRSYAREFATLRSRDADVLAGFDLTPYHAKTPDRVLRLTLAMDHSLMEHADSVARFPADEVSTHHTAPAEADDGDIEWEDTMAAMNRASTARSVLWELVDEGSGAENMEIKTWRFQRGDRIKIRLVNDSAAMHPMQHPIHFHGQRFLVLATNGVRNDNPAWQDTVLVPRSATVDILLDASNPGKWMAHCHIAEHEGSGMMLPFRVQR